MCISKSPALPELSLPSSASYYYAIMHNLFARLLPIFAPLPISTPLVPASSLLSVIGKVS